MPFGMANLYEKLECIGKGSFGEVFKGRELSTNKIVALKLVDLEKIDEEIEILQREIKVMSQISNPHVVQYYSSLMVDSTLWIVMEFMSAGSLKDLIDTVGPLPEEAIATVMKALCKGLDYVHKGRKLHRDIKAANILLSSQGEVKLADFGVAGQMTTTFKNCNTVVGSPFWMAPEVIKKSLYNEKADIWSLAITGIELAQGLPPYAKQHPYRALRLIPTSPPPRLEGGHFSKPFRDFIALCLKKTYTERPSAEQLLNHSFLRKARPSSIKELIRRKQQITGEVEEKVILGGDSLTESQNSSPRRSEPKESANKGHGAGWEFDFGSLTESATEVVQPTDSNVATETESPVSNLDHADSIDLKTTGPEQFRSKQASLQSNDYVGTSQPKSSSSEAPKSLILSELILPVISRIRADEDTSGSRNSDLMAQLGTLEVAFVDAENAKPGVSMTLLEALFEEAVISQVWDVQAFANRALQKNRSKGT